MKKYGKQGRQKRALDRLQAYLKTFENNPSGRAILTYREGYTNSRIVHIKDEISTLKSRLGVG